MGKASKRQLQVGETIKRHFGAVLQQEGAYVYGMEILVTVTNVIMSPDLGIAKIYFSVYNTENKQAVLFKLDHHKHRLKQSLVARIKKQMRRAPEIHFYLDETIDEMYRVDEMFKKINDEE